MRNAKLGVAAALALLCCATFPVFGATRIVTNLADSGPGSLRATIAASGDGDSIDFADGLAGTLMLTSGELLVSNSIAILGPGPASLAINGNGSGRVFHIIGQTVAISDLTITNGLLTTFDGGGGIYSEADLTLNNCIVIGNVSGGPGGGGIYNLGTLTIHNCAVNSNSAPSAPGGGIWSNGPLTIAGGVISSNSGYSGGGIYSGMELTVSNSLISANSGGGILSGNPAGGVVSLVVSSTVTGNSSGYGGGIENEGALTIRSSLIISNSASQEGGGIENYGTLMIIDSTLAGNSSYQGGGILSGYGAELGVTNTTFFGNVAERGGGIYNIAGANSAHLDIINTTFSGNTANQEGGAIVNDGNYGSAALTILNSTFSGNSSPFTGGILNVGATASMFLGSSIFNAGVSGVTMANVSGLSFSYGYNMSSDGAGGDGTKGPGGLLSSSHDIRNTDPMLGPLRDNGGPTLTHALLPGSPAIDKGRNFAALTTDQRGQPRTYDNPGLPNASGGDGTDIGAFEFFPPTLGIAPNFGNVVLSWSTNDPGYKVEFTSALGIGATWTTVPGTPIVVGDRYLLGDGPVNGNRFYRLRTP